MHHFGSPAVQLGDLVADDARLLQYLALAQVGVYLSDLAVQDHVLSVDLLALFCQAVSFSGGLTLLDSVEHGLLAIKANRQVRTAVTTRGARHARQRVHHSPARGAF